MEKVNLLLIKELRVQKKMSQSEMAEELGFNNMWTYHRKERGEQSFTAEELNILAKFHKKKMENFFVKEVAENANKEKRAAV
ncbi:helix-turn-helix transcriptional regulator [Planococcus kocurii]|uniref:helix-turn-helix transcriptional regulator n=1 Tax=Planococcus kocurii TaxID=1374 RepID=UPI003D084488